MRTTRLLDILQSFARRFGRSPFAIDNQSGAYGLQIMLGLDTVESVAHVIQVALTPVFLLSGIASLLGVLSTRLARVADRVDALAEQLEADGPIDRHKLQRRLAYLRRRSHVLDAAVMMGTLGGVATSCAALLLFVGTLRDRPGASLFVAFGLALLFTMGALVAFLIKCCSPAVGYAIRRTTQPRSERCTNSLRRELASRLVASRTRRRHKRRLFAFLAGCAVCQRQREPTI
jgi:Protein of unknown function (DUF2721)